VSGHSIGARLARALRWLAARRLFMPLTARVICAQAVRESPAFFVREVTRPAGIRCYHLRENGVQVAVRHSAGDAATLAEVFHRHDYEPIQDVAEAIGEPGRILDLGANIGLFGAFAVSRWPQAKIVGYEADPANVVVHDRAIAANELGDRGSVKCAAAGAHDGEVELAAGRAMGSFVVGAGVTLAVPTIQVPMRDVLAEVCAADLVKLDIEGGEWEILLDPRFAQRPPRAVVLEYHPHLCPGADPRATAEQALVRANLSIASIWHRDDGYGMLWAWRTDARA
jgi:FkbM family methyltransferase